MARRAPQEKPREPPGEGRPLELEHSPQGMDGHSEAAVGASALRKSCSVVSARTANILLWETSCGLPSSLTSHEHFEGKDRICLLLLTLRCAAWYVEWGRHWGASEGTGTCPGWETSAQGYDFGFHSKSREHVGFQPYKTLRAESEKLNIPHRLQQHPQAGNKVPVSKCGKRLKNK